MFNWLKEEGLDYGIVAALFGFVLIVLAIHLLGITESNVFAWLFGLAPIWLPILTFSIFFWKYMDAGHVVIDSHVPQGLIHYDLDEMGMMVLVED